METWKLVYFTTADVNRLSICNTSVHVYISVSELEKYQGGSRFPGIRSIHIYEQGPLVEKTDFTEIVCNCPLPRSTTEMCITLADIMWSIKRYKYANNKA